MCADRTDQYIHVRRPVRAGGAHTLSVREILFSNLLNDIMLSTLVSGAVALVLHVAGIPSVVALVLHAAGIPSVVALVLHAAGIPSAVALVLHAAGIPSAVALVLHAAGIPSAVATSN